MLGCRRVRKACGLALVLACSVAVAPAATADVLSGSPILQPGEGALLVAGDVVDISWRPLPADVQELELLLRLDEGAATQVRLTEQLTPSACTHRWTVPNLPSRGARLVIRMNRGFGEEELPAGGRFGIVAERGAPTAAITLRNGEWWTRRGGQVTAPPQRPRDQVGSATTPPVAADHADAPSEQNALPARLAAPLTTVPTGAVQPPAPAATCLRHPRTFPLRP